MERIRKFLRLPNKDEVPSEAGVDDYFKLIKRTDKNKVRGTFSNEYGDMVSVEPRRFIHVIGRQSYGSDGVRIVVRQQLPEINGRSDALLSTVFTFDNDNKKEIRVSTCVVVPDENAQTGFLRVGDLRTDYFEKGKKELVEGNVDGNDDGFGLPTGEWYIKGEAFGGAMVRAYQLIKSLVFKEGFVSGLAISGSVDLLEESVS